MRDFINSCIDKFWEHPIISIIVFSLIADGTNAAWGKSRPVAEFFEQILAEVLHWGGAIGAFVLSFYAYEFIDKRTNKPWMAWIVCIVVFSVVGLALAHLTSSIPGVGWRIDRLPNADNI